MGERFEVKFMNRAVFLDRDGVINEMVFYKERNEYGPPHDALMLKIIDGATDALRNLTDSGFKIFLVSNQPDYAKGKTSLENILEVGKEFEYRMKQSGVEFSGYFYCYHHPKGIVREYSLDCECRKPKNFFVMKAIEENDLNADGSWFVGDRDMDVECGRRSGLKTIKIRNRFEESNISADYEASGLKEAVEIILKKNDQSIS